MMFVLPPPPRYPTQAAYNAAVASGQAAPMIETNNILTNPTGPEYQLLVGEGVYMLKEDLHLATPPPHPSEAPIINPNPLATSPQPASAGTKISLLSLSSKSTAPLLYKVGTNMSTLSGPEPPIQEHPNEGSGSIDLGSDEGAETSVSGSTKSPLQLRSSAPAFGEGNASLAAPIGKKTDKRTKPKNNIAKSNSSFISRVIVSETLSKRLQEHDPEGFFAFANINRAFQWLDLTSATKQEHLTKILFTKAHCLCHDLNMVTKSISHIDLIMGFSTGEIIWYEPISQKYTRLNKNGIINSTPVSEIRWIPGSENLFLAAHMDGSLIVYDKEKEDAAFVPEEKTNGDVATPEDDGSAFSRDKIHVVKSVHSHNQKANPVALWKLSTPRINAFSFSPDSRHLAVVSEDGTLRLIDYLQEKLLSVYTSYYGGFTALCWSPDGKYLLTGGQDDLVTIWSISERAIVARCQGHQSWVTNVAFDPWRCDDKNYRFGSVGEDSRLLLWDFNVGMLTRKKGPGSTRHRASVVSRWGSIVANTAGAALGRELTATSRAKSEGEDEGVEDGIRHAVEPRSEVPMLPPVLNKSIDIDPLCWLTFTKDAILTSCKHGHIRTWNRPQDVPNASETSFTSSS